MVGLLLQIMKSYKIIDADGTVNARYKKKLLAFPELMQKIIYATRFLRYEASVLTRIQCLIRGVREQPTCKTCGRVTKMRMNGRERYTFPRYCSGRCAAKDPEIQAKRVTTNGKKSFHYV